MKRFLLTLCALAMAVPVVAQQVIPTGVTTTRIKFVMVDDAGDPVEGATITGVSRVRGTGSYTAMTTPTTGHLGGGLHYLVADEDTGITGGLAREDMTFVIEASDAKTAFVQAVIEAEQATVEGIGDEIEGRELTLAADQSGVTQLGGITVSGTYMPSNVQQWNSSNVATPATAGYPAVTIKDGTGTGEIDTSGGAIVDARATGAGAEFTPTGGRLYFVDGTTDGTGDTGTRAAPFDTISSAISAAAPGDTIFIYDGTYSGALSWSKEGLTLIGESTAGVIISHSSGATITVPDNTTLVRMTVNTSDTTTGASINLEDENFVTLQEVICNGKFDGIQAGNSFAFHATRCRFFGTYDGANLNAARNFLCDQCWFQTDCTYATSTDFHGAVCGSSSSDPITSATDGEFRNCTFFAQEEGNTSFRTSAVGGSGRIVFNGCTLVAWATHASGTGAVRALYERDSSNNSQFTLRDCTVDVYQEGSGSCRYFEIQGAASKLLYSSLAKTSIDTVAADLGAVTNIAPSASDNNDAITASFNLSGGVVSANVTQYNGIAATSNGGLPTVNLAANQGSVTQLGGLNIVGSTVAANVTHFGGTAGTFTSGIPAVNTTQISSDSTAADNAELMFDGTGYAGGTTKLGVNAIQWLGTALATPDTAGYPKVTMKNGTDSGELSITSGVVNSRLISSGSGSITSSTFASGAIMLETDVLDVVNEALADPDNLTAIASSVVDLDLSTGHSVAGSLAVLSNSTYDVTAKLDDTVEDPGSGTYRFTSTSLAEAPVSSGGGQPISPRYEIEGHVWRFSQSGQLTGRPNITEQGEFDGLLVMDFDTIIPKTTSILTAELAESPGVGITVDDPLMLSPNKRAVHIVAASSTDGTYTFVVKVTTTDGQSFQRIGIFKLRGN